ncbi:MAG: DUF6088 family protein [Gemmatimonadaceae bacterium]
MLVSFMEFAPSLSTDILSRIGVGPDRGVWTPTDFGDMASRDAIDKALQRLTNVQTLRRIDRGLYDKPSSNKLTQQLNPYVRIHA